MQKQVISKQALSQTGPPGFSLQTSVLVSLAAVHLEETQQKAKSSPTHFNIF